MNLELENEVRVAVSRLNRSQSAYAGGWSLYTASEVAKVIERLESIRAEKLEAIEDVERVLVSLRQAL